MVNLGEGPTDGWAGPCTILCQVYYDGCCQSVRGDTIVAMNSIRSHLGLRHTPDGWGGISYDFTMSRFLFRTVREKWILLVIFKLLSLLISCIPHLPVTCLVVVLITCMPFSHNCGTNSITNIIVHKRTVLVHTHVGRESSM